jgi:cytochrome c-type biogenesis protein CcmH
LRPTTLLALSLAWLLSVESSALGAPASPRTGAKVTPAAPDIPAATEREAKALERLLVAPCCFKGTLEDHASGVAVQMRREIRQMLVAGKSRRQILDHYRRQYGQAVLAEPPEGGLSGLFLYGIPFGLAALGLLVMTVLLTRRRSASPRDAQKQPLLPPDHQLPAEMEQRIDALIAARRNQ